jgi:cell wall assembly regulator SMI1
MTDDVRKTPIEKLELSVRTAEWLKGLTLATVGELLDLPTIALPADWPAKIGALVAAELKEVFESLGVTYGGDIVMPPRKESSQRALGGIQNRWKTIAAWLDAAHPDALEQFRPPASPAAIAAAEAAIGHTLPDDYKQFLLIHDGQEEFAPMIMGPFLPIEQVVAATKEMIGEPDPINPADVGDGIRPVDYSPAWIPICQSDRGRDYLCLDLDPGPGGTRGQIVEYAVDNLQRPLIARSFSDLLSLYFERAQAGELPLDD